MTRRATYFAFLALCVLLLAGCGREGRAQAYLQRGLDLYAQGNLVKARLEFKNVLQIDPRNARAWFMLGQIEERQENRSGAYDAYTRAVELDPVDREARIRKGVLALAGDEPESALAEVEAVLSTSRTDPGALALRAAVKQRQGDLDGGVTDAQAALAQNPAHREALSVLASIRVEQGQPAEAKALLETAVKSHPNDTALKLALASVYEQLGEPAAVRRLLIELVEQEPDTFDHRLRLARFFAAQRDLDLAEQTLRAAVEAAPGDLERKLTLLDFLAESKGHGAAITELEGWIEAEPDDYDLRFALIDRYRDAGQLDAMDAALRAVIERDGTGPHGPKARGQRAALMVARNQPDDALTLAEEALKGDSQNADALLARAAVALQRDDADRAVIDLRTLLRNDPTAAGALRLLSQAHLLKGELPLAQEALEKAIEAEPKESAAYLQLADLQAKAGNVGAAAHALERLIAQVPEDPVTQTALARIELKEQDATALERVAEQVLSTHPEHPTAHYIKGLVLKGRGELGPGVEQLEIALSVEPEAAEPLVALARTYLDLKQPEKAEARLKQVLGVNPANLVAIELLREVYVAMGQTAEARQQGKWVEPPAAGSHVAYQRLLLTAPLLYQEAGDLEAAIAAYEDVLKRNPELDVAANNLAMLLADRRAADAASLARARELMAPFESSEQAAFLDTAGWVQYRSGNYQRAVDLLEKATNLGDATPEHQYHLGMAYLKLGRIAEGKSLLSSALDANHPFSGLDEARAVLATP